MKHLRLVALALAATTWTASLALACDGNGASAANAKGSCAAHRNATAATNCPMHSGANAATAAAAGGACPAMAGCPAGSAQCAGHASGTAATAASAGNGACSAAMAAQCTAAMRAQCGKHAKGASAVTAANEHCAHGANAVANMDCCAKGAAAAKAGMGSCVAGAATMAGMVHCDRSAAHDCAVCSEEAACANELRNEGVRSQVVSLRNGAMILFTADSPEAVRALQATMARSNERILAAYAGDSQASLCSECREFRGARASGKYSRELVNVKTGCQLLLTSPDRGIVRRIHDMTASQVAARTRL